MLGLLSNIYGYFVGRRNRNFDAGRIEVYKPDIPVISIGNISTGGSGKTPFSIWLAQRIIELEGAPAVVGRGYKRKGKGLVLVSDGLSILADYRQAGDEMSLIAEKLKIPVVVDKKKVVAAQYANENLIIDCIIIDDGFQHRYVYRDLDIVIIDEATIKNQFLLPKGRLREMPESLKRADIIVYNNTSLELSDNYGKIVVKAHTKISGIKLMQNDENSELASEISGKFAAVCGIANPQRFFSSLEEKKINIEKKYIFGDHHNYTCKHINKIIKYCVKNSIGRIITTEKDYVKLKEFQQLFQNNSINCYVLEIVLKIDSGQKELEEKICKILKIKL